MARDPDNSANPFERPSVWPRAPQAPIWIGGRPLRPRSPPEPAPTPSPASSIFSGAATPLPPRPAAPPPGAQASSAPPSAGPPPVRPSRRPPPAGLRLTPLIAAGAVGIGGIVALFLLIEGHPPPPQPTPSSTSALRVGAVVSPVELSAETAPGEGSQGRARH